MSIVITTDTRDTVIPEVSRTRRGSWRLRHPIWHLILIRAAIGVVTLWAVSLLVFFATQILPGNAATAVLGANATPERVAKLRGQMGLDQPLVTQYVSWLGRILSGNAGNSLINNRPVLDSVGPKIVNTMVLVVLAGVAGLVIAGLLGLAAAWYRGSLFDRVGAVVSLVVTSLPEFVIAISLIIFFSINVFHILPAVASIPPGGFAWDDPRGLILPAATLTILTIPYTYYMVRAALVEALESDYSELAQLKGVSARRLLLVHGLPNALPPVVQVMGLNLLALAGGVVVVEYVFNYPGLGSALVQAMTNRDIPVVQFLVLILSAFYVVVNIVTDVVTLMVTPRRRSPR